MLLRAIPEMGFKAEGVSTGEEALRLMRTEPASVVIMDLNLPGIGGMKVFEKIRVKWPQTQVIILTGYGDLDAAQQAIRLNVADFLTKPCGLGDLERALDRAWRRRLGDEDKPALTAPGATDDDAEGEMPQTIQDMEKKMIIETLKRNKGNRSATARELGISIRTLYYRLSKYNIENEETPGQG